MIFSFTSEDTIASVLLQKNKDGHEQPIAFMSKVLQNSKLNYNTMEKQDYALVKSLKHFRTYVGYSKIIAFVPHSAVKDILTQTDCLGTRARWVTKIQEYDLEIRPTKLVKGSCQACQLFTGKQKLVALPLQPVVVEAPFQNWVLDFIGKFHENSNNDYLWILIATDYFTKWVEAIPAKNATEKVIMDFIKNNIITRFGVPAKITTDNVKGNGLAESSNKNLITIIKKIVGDNKRSWDSKIKYALWADRITKKKATGKSPFELVYGLDVTLPVHLKLPAYQLLQRFSTNKDVQNKIDQIVELDETRRITFDNICKSQFNSKKSFDKSSRSRSLQVGDMVLLWDRKNEKPRKHKKFGCLWLGPYIIRDIDGPNSFHLRRLDGESFDLPTNGQMLKLLFKDDISCHEASSVLYF
eukprot:PITA_15867